MVSKKQAEVPMIFFWVDIEQNLQNEDSTINQFLEEIYGNEEISKRLVGINQSGPITVNADLLINGKNIIALDENSAKEGRILGNKKMSNKIIIIITY